MSVGLLKPYCFINGTQINLPSVFREAPKMLQSVEEAFNGGRRIDAKWLGDALPDRPITYDWMLDWELDSEYEDEADFLEQLRVTPGPHTFVYWKKRINLWTAASGQTGFYLPRPDAFAEGYSGHTTSEWRAVVSLDGVAMAEEDVIYAESVTSGTSVDAGDVQISETAVDHPDSGQTVAFFKFGTAPGAGTIVTVEYFPLYQVDVVSLDTTPFTGQNVGREDKSLTLIEVA